MTPEEKLQALAKPPGSLGLLEDWAAVLCHAQGTLTPTANPASILVFCGDHGVKKGDAMISPFPPSVSQAVFRALAAGVSATGVLTKAAGAHLTVVDVGLDGDVGDLTGPSVRHAKIDRGTADFRTTPAMDHEAFDRALAAGAAALTAEVVQRRSKVVGIGEVGIGNTTASAAVLAMLLNYGGDRVDPGDCCGRGTGVDDAGMAHKRQVVRDACAFHKATIDADVAASLAAAEAEADLAKVTPEAKQRLIARRAKSAHARAVLRCLGGFEHVAMAGAFLEAAQPRKTSEQAAFARASSGAGNGSDSSIDEESSRAQLVGDSGGKDTFRVVTIVDGFISAVAALAAVRMACENDGEETEKGEGAGTETTNGVRTSARSSRLVRHGMVFATDLAEEPTSPHGGRLLAAALDDMPDATVGSHYSCQSALSMGLRLGEASGAALALPLLRSAAAMVSNMGTLQEVMALGSGS